MSITLTYTFATAQELAAHLNGADRHTPPAPAVVSGAQGATPAKKPDAPAASSPSGATPQATAKQEPAPETGTAADNGRPYTVDDAKALTMKLVAAKGRDTAVTLLKKYDVPVAAKLPAEKVAAFCAEAEELLK